MAIYDKSEYVCPSCNGGIHRSQKSSVWLVLALPFVYYMALAFSHKLTTVGALEIAALVSAAIGGVGYWATESYIKAK